jgi:hypothetical protein
MNEKEEEAGKEYILEMASLVVFWLIVSILEGCCLERF